MDVRCEKCLTEYELDEARLKPTGVTVKCTNCGHMFKIRKRANTNVGSAPRAPTAQPRPQTASGPLSDPMAAPPDPEDTGSNPALPTPASAPDMSISPASARTPPMGSGTASARTPTVRPAESARITSPEAIAATMVTTDEQPTPARSFAPVSRSPVAVGGGHILPDQPPPSPPRPVKPTPPPPPPGRGVGAVPPAGGDRAT